MSHDSTDAGFDSLALLDDVLLGRTSPAAMRGIPERTLRDLGWQSICDRIAEHCATRMAEEAARDLGFLADPETALRRAEEVAEALGAAYSGTLPAVGSAAGIADLVQRAGREDILSGDELLDVGRTAQASSRLRAALRGATHLPRVAAHAGRLADVGKLGDELVDSFEPSGEIRDGAWPELARLRRRVKALRTTISERLQRILRDPRYEGILQDEFVTLREERYVVPVRSGERGDFPGIVHGHSNTGATLFIEPEEIVGLNNDFRLAQLDVERETRRILTKLTARVARAADELLGNEKILTYLDLTFAIGRAGASSEWTMPRVGRSERGGRIELRGAAHPVLAERARAGELELVRNTIRLDGGARLLVVSGPNTGGKTVTLKTVGLVALMVRAGLPVPARSDSEFPWFERIFCDIGDEQAVERDLSTFSAHLRNLTAFLPDCDERSLVLLDELFAGTDPEQGAALGRAVLEELASRGSAGVVTTHLERLKTLAMEDGRFACASVTFDVERLVPTYILRMGVPGSSYALRIAERLGLSRRVVQRASELLGDGSSMEREQLIERLEAQHRELDALRDDVERRARALDRDEEKIAARLRSLEERGRKAVDDASRETIDELRALRRRMRELERSPRPDDPEAARAWMEDARRTVKEVDERTRREAEERAERSAPAARAPVVAETLRVGDSVFVRSFARTGTVVELPRPDRVVVQLGTMRASFTPAELGTSDATPEASTRPGDRGPALPAVERNPSNTLDLRGQTAEDAVEQLDAWLDRAVRSHQAMFLVIHGHGTGVLKRAVRGHLSESRYPLRFRPGERTEGGDGVTVVALYEAPTTDAG